MVFWGTGRSPALIDRTVHAVDLAVTLAALYKLPVPAGVDGVALPEIVE